jgi:hypothetical protein
VTAAKDRLELFTEMLRIRRFEERCVELYSSAAIRGFMHLCIGEELHDVAKAAPTTTTAVLRHLPQAQIDKALDQLPEEIRALLRPDGKGRAVTGRSASELPGGWPSSPLGYRTIATEQCERCSTAWLTEPSIRLAAPPLPRDPTTTICARRDSATSACAGRSRVTIRWTRTSGYFSAHPASRSARTTFASASMASQSTMGAIFGSAIKSHHVCTAINGTPRTLACS